jgi:iron complex outermembrane receptor protein
VIRMTGVLAAAACWGVVLAGDAQVAGAQTTGELAGIVRDETGAVVPGVTVTLTSERLAAPVAIETDHQGRFAIRLLPGRYHVRADAAGFARWEKEVELKAGGATLDVSLGIRLSDRVTVTATRTGAADIQTTGVAITALDTKTLDQAAVERIEHLTGLVPTLSVSQTPGDTPLLTLRGIGSNSAIPGAEPTVTMQVDGVYLARGTAMALDFLDVERVEVLRGPQGTLFGRNSIGGTINILTRQPTNALETRARLTAGNYGKLRVEGAISGPLVRNRIMGSFAFLRGSRDGFVVDVDHPDHPLGSEDTWAGRGQLRFVFGSRHELLVSGDYSSARGVPLTLARPLAPNPAVPPGTPGFDIPDDFWSVRPNALADGRNKQSGASARLTVRLGDTATLTSLTAYRDGDHLLFVDADTTEHALATTRTSSGGRQVSQEVTLAQRTTRLSWIGGVFRFDEHLPGSIEIPPFRGQSTIDADAWALFGQASYRLWDHAAVTGGLRYSHEREEGHGIAAGGPVYDVMTEVADAAWTPKVSVELEASRNTFLFLSATRGFKSSGVNVFSQASGTTFRPELAWSYEAGWKRTLPGGRGRMNAALFYVDYRDLQVQSFIVPGLIEVSNAGRATSRGIEVEGALSAGGGLQFLGILSWLDAVYGRYVAVVGPNRVPVDATGKRLREAPKWSGSGAAIYEFKPGAIGTVSVRSDVSWQSRVFFTPGNDAVQSQPAYALVHARTMFVPRTRRWEVSVYVQNLGRQEYVTGTWVATRGVAISGRPGRPRHWGTEFTIRR